jgi:hypothetical protein
VDDTQKKVAAERIRAHLKIRVSRLLGCEPADLPSMKIGAMAHFLFLLIGDGETMPGFNTALSALKDLIGSDLMWDVEPKTEEVETPKVVVN